MKFFLAFLFIFLPVIVYSQESIGFEDEAGFQKLIDYWLPSRGYKNFYLSSGNIQYTNRTQTSLSFFIENKMSINAGASYNYSKRFRKDETTSITFLERTDTDRYFNFSVGVRYYFNRNLY